MRKRFARGEIDSQTAATEQPFRLIAVDGGNGGAGHRDALAYRINAAIALATAAVAAATLSSRQR